MDLYLHLILAHYGDSFEKNSFVRMSSERGEWFISEVKQILRSFTNRRLDQALNEVFVRYFAETQMKVILAAMDQERAGAVTIDTCQPPNKKFSAFRDILAHCEDVRFLVPEEHDESDRAKSVRAFIKKMKELEYGDLITHTTEGEYIFHVAADVKNCLEETNYQKRKRN